MIDPTNGLRAIRSHNTVGPKLIFLYLGEQVFKQAEESPVKVRQLASVLGLKPLTVRRGLAHLVRLQLLEVVAAATRGTPGVYRLGAAANLAVPIFDRPPRPRAPSRAVTHARTRAQPAEVEASKALSNA